MKNFSNILIEKKSFKNAVFFLFELTYDKCYDLKKDLMFKIFHFVIDSLKIYIWAKNNRYNYMNETYYEQFGKHFVIRSYAYNELSSINEACNFVNIFHSSNVNLCLSFVENFVPNNFFAKNLIENQKIIQCLKLELDFINLKFKTELFFITKSKHINYHNFIEKTYLIEYSAIIVQKLFDFYIEIASFKFYKFFIDKTEIKIVNQKYERLFLENDNMVTLKSPINSNYESIEIILLSNLSLKIRFIENINSKKNKLKTDHTSCNHEAISQNQVKFRFKVYLSEGLEEKLKRNEVKIETFFCRYYQLCKFDNLFFQDLGFIKNFFSLDLNVKYYNTFSFVDLSLKNRIKSFDD